MDERMVVSATVPRVSATAFIATFSTAMGLIIVFLLLDITLARIDQRENGRHAANEYAEGSALLARGNAAAARERFASAAAKERSNTTYALGLTQAMIAEGRAADAELALDALLDRAGNSGAVNLVMARLLAGTGRGDEASVYFHRAIVGRWGADSTARRTEARFELIELLAARHDDRAMLGELLPLEASFPDSVALQRRLAHLFIRAGAPRRGLSILRDLVRTDPRDGDAYAGLGEAALALGNFTTARADLAQAVQLRPDDAHLAGRLALADTILTMHPGMRGLSTAERGARARMLLERTIAEVSRCNGPGAPAGPVADSARAALVPGIRAREGDPEQFIRFAMTIGSSIATPCADGGRQDEVVTLLLRQLDQ